ncbi:MAG: aminotransferase [Gemmatimonadetes bacterium]|nr:aminotransferase [Gemmatimonadota bacterium]
MVSVDDRGFLFADGIYEVTPAYRGAFFRLDRHLERMRRGLDALKIDFDPAALADVHGALLAANGFEQSPTCYVYAQVTRGVAPRAHAFPTTPVKPTVYAFAREFARPAREVWDQGFAAVTVPDRRWARADLKTIGLLANCLALQAAVDAGATDALLVRDGIAIEGAHSNFFAVIDGTVITHPATNQILHGITRAFVLELSEQLGLPVSERPIQIEELARVQEAFFTGTTTEVRPTVRIDGKPVGDGKVGPVARKLLEAYIAGSGRAAAGAGRAAAGVGAR